GASSAIIFGRDVLARIVLQEQRRDNRNDRTHQDVDRDRYARFVGREQRGRNQRRRTTGKYRRQLIADRSAAVAQSRREAFGDQGSLWSILHVVRDQRQQDRQEEQHGGPGVDEAEVDETEDAHRGAADDVHLFAADQIGDVAAQRN